MIELLISILFILGAVFILIAAMGLIKFNDLFSRMHATTKSTSFGVLFIIIGTALHFNSADVYLRAVLIILFIYLTAPLAAHAIAKSFIDLEKQDKMK